MAGGLVAYAEPVIKIDSIESGRQQLQEKHITIKYMTVCMITIHMIT